MTEQPETKKDWRYYTNPAKWNWGKIALSIVGLLFSSLGAVFIKDNYLTPKPVLPVRAVVHRFQLPPDSLVAPYDQPEITKYLTVNITNNGNKIAKDVQIAFGNSEFFYSVDSDSEVKRASKLIELGALQRGTSFDVRIWGNDKLDDQNFTVADSEKSFPVSAQRGTFYYSPLQAFITAIAFGMVIVATVSCIVAIIWSHRRHNYTMSEMHRMHDDTMSKAEAVNFHTTEILKLANKSLEEGKELWATIQSWNDEGKGPKETPPAIEHKPDDEKPPESHP